jgi:hypothetical protein
MTVPFSPFVSDVQVGKLESIASTCNSIDGTFITDLRYPADNHNGAPATLFSTRITIFWNLDHLAKPITRTPCARYGGIST